MTHRSKSETFLKLTRRKGIGRGQLAIGPCMTKMQETSNALMSNCLRLNAFAERQSLLSNRRAIIGTEN